MKKMIAGVLALLLCFSAAGCAGTEDPNQTVAEFTDAEQLQPLETEITMDNWQDFFELRETRELVGYESGDEWEFGLGLFLKDGYEFQSGQVNFELEYQLEQRAFSEESGEPGNPAETGHTPEPRAKTFALTDYRGNPDIAEDSPFYGAVAAWIYGGGVLEQEDGSLIAEVPGKASVLHAEGSLVVVPVR